MLYIHNETHSVVLRIFCILKNKLQFEFSQSKLVLWYAPPPSCMIARYTSQSYDWTSVDTS